jgi:hypothetical protein
MAEKKPLCNYNGVIKELQSGDTLPGGSSGIIPPIGSVIAWHKAFYMLSSDTTTSTSSGKLVDSGATFITDGVEADMIVLNTTDVVYTTVTSVDSETQLTLADDIMTSGEDYNIYATPKLPDGWLECDGSTISDGDSPYNGATLPDINGDERFLRGYYISGANTNDSFQGHHHTTERRTGSGSSTVFSTENTGTAAHGVTALVIATDPKTDGTNGTPRTGDETKPISMTVVYIMRIK